MKESLGKRMRRVRGAERDETTAKVVERWRASGKSRKAFADEARASRR